MCDSKHSHIFCHMTRASHVETSHKWGRRKQSRKCVILFVCVCENWKGYVVKHNYVN